MIVYMPRCNNRDHKSTSIYSELRPQLVSWPINHDRAGTHKTSPRFASALPGANSTLPVSAAGTQCQLQGHNWVREELPKYVILSSAYCRSHSSSQRIPSVTDFTSTCFIRPCSSYVFPQDPILRTPVRYCSAQSEAASRKRASECSLRAAGVPRHVLSFVGDDTRSYRTRVRLPREIVVQLPIRIVVGKILIVSQSCT